MSIKLFCKVYCVFVKNLSGRGKIRIKSLVNIILLIIIDYNSIIMVILTVLIYKYNDSLI